MKVFDHLQRLVCTKCFAGRLYSYAFEVRSLLPNTIYTPSITFRMGIVVLAHLTYHQLLILFCVIGFCGTFFGLVSISHLIALSVERYYSVVSPYRSYAWSLRPLLSLYMVIPSWIYGLLWALFPLLGWSNYQPFEVGSSINIAYILFLLFPPPPINLQIFLPYLSLSYPPITHFPLPNFLPRFLLHFLYFSTYYFTIHLTLIITPLTYLLFSIYR